MVVLSGVSRSILAVTFLVLTPLKAQDALDIVRKAVSHDESNWERAKSYTYITRMTFREKDGSGSVKKTNQKTHDVLFLYGETYEKLIEEDGKPLPADKAKKEQEKLDKLIVKRQKESEADRQKRIAKFENERREERDMMKEIPEAYNLRLTGEEPIGGRKAWVIEATPKPDFKPKNSRAAILKKFKGKLWVDQAEYQVVKMDGEVIDTVSFGLFLARLSPGSRILFEAVRVNDEVWMPKHIRADFDARFVLLKKFYGDFDLRFEDFRKFQSDSKVVETAEVVERK